MPRLEFTTALDAPPQTVWSLYTDLSVLEKITPKGTRVRLPDPLPTLSQGTRFTLVVTQPPLFVPLAWETEIVAFEPPQRFVDIQRRGPFARWEHVHAFEPQPGGGTTLRDVIVYEPPFGPLGRLADALLLRRLLTQMFASRHEATRKLLAGILE
jgi:hypothetical protein